jgi:hypothetical protein
MVTRRTFIAAGAAGSVALGAAWWWRRFSATPEGTLALRADADAIVAAVAAVMLDSALPAGDAARTAAIGSAASGVRQAIAGLPPAAQREVDQLFALLAFAPARVALARLSSPWPLASRDEVAAFLDRWRTSRVQLFRAAYDALHQLVFAAWYGQPSAWPAIGYPGPPDIDR